MEHIQDPSMYFSKTTGKTGTGVAFFSGDAQDSSNDQCSGVPIHSGHSNHSGFYATTASTSSRSHINQKVADDYLAMFSSFMASYENFIGGKIHDPEVIEEDFRQIDLVDLENGVVERKNRTLIETARTMMSDAKLPVTFWAEAVNTGCHVLNRVLVVKRHNKTCYELINNQLPNLDYLVPFGSPYSLLLQYKDRQSKFHAKAVEGIFLGYVANSPCKRVYNMGTRTVEEWFEVDCSKHSIPPEPTGPA
ncbi:hypothetical protein L1987_69100 [Smallanthus sonchifolius]|uniref:Uncharacterized protein n=1 Tax=Smallanthus sonchifolius TaxID=185202 RepID=A0ACB9B4M7_9ASTR|nr:hypothetical protein L1987_69100 [Smallanthus sonchifolius]